MEGLLPVVNGTKAGQMKFYQFKTVSQGKYKFQSKDTAAIYQPHILYIYGLRNGISSVEIFNLDSFKTAKNGYLFLTGTKEQKATKLYRKLNESTNIYDFIIEILDNSSCLFEVISTNDNITINTTTEEINSWERIDV